MDETIFCNFCSKKFKNKYTLKSHQTTAKICLKLQNKDINQELDFQCFSCKKPFSSKYNLDNHLLICKESDKIKIQELNKQLESFNTKIVKLKDKIKDLEQFKIYKDLYEQEKNKNSNLEIENKLLTQEYKINLEKLASKAIENSGIKNTTINNNKNQIFNNLQPLTDEHMREQTKHLTYQNIQNGAHGMAHFASNFTFKERVMCTDKSRLNFVFKNENDLIIKDPEGVEITKRFIHINRDEILRLVEIYLSCITTELNDINTSGDMYKFWAGKREEFIAIRSAVMKGNVIENEYSYKEFKKNFLQALSDLVPR